MNKFEKIQDRVQKILKVVENDEATDGLDAISAALSTTLAMAQATGIFSKNDVHEFIMEFERKINKVLANKPDVIQRKKNISISRKAN